MGVALMSRVDRDFVRNVEGFQNVAAFGISLNTCLFCASCFSKEIR